MSCDSDSAILGVHGQVNRVSRSKSNSRCPLIFTARIRCTPDTLVLNRIAICRPKLAVTGQGIWRLTMTFPHLDTELAHFTSLHLRVPVLSHFLRNIVPHLSSLFYDVYAADGLGRVRVHSDMIRLMFATHQRHHAAWTDHLIVFILLQDARFSRISVMLVRLVFEVFRLALPGVCLRNQGLLIVKLTHDNPMIGYLLDHSRLEAFYLLLLL